VGEVRGPSVGALGALCLLGEVGAAVDLLKSVCSEDLCNGKASPTQKWPPCPIGEFGECETVAWGRSPPVSVTQRLAWMDPAPSRSVSLPLPLCGAIR